MTITTIMTTANAINPQRSLSSNGYNTCVQQEQQEQYADNNSDALRARARLSLYFGDHHCLIIGSYTIAMDA
jgi:hypothetical protein